MTNTCDIGLIGLAVMGQNLVLNMNDHGYKVAVYNRTTSTVDAFITGSAKNTAVVGTHSLEALVATLSSPRKIMLMVRAGNIVDSVIDQLLLLLEPGDVIIDGGNSNSVDTQRRTDELEAANIWFVGAGISGGEDGARHGPSIMPGGHPKAWPLVKDILQAIAAKTDDGTPCCDWVGNHGAGHFVKMVHNGIEYGDMQLIGETYHFMKDYLGMDNKAMQATFARWNKGDLGSYLIEITADILGYQEDGQYVLDSILDKAGQKGTGKWTAISALELGIPLTLIGEAVFARTLSTLKAERCHAADILKGPGVSKTSQVNDVTSWVDALEQALLASKIVSYAQGFMLMREASEHNRWGLQYGAIGQLWRQGCIIRSVFLDDIKRAYDSNAELKNLLLDSYFNDKLQRAQQAWRETIARAFQAGIPMPAMSAALAFYDGYRSAKLPANLLQAQRDYFGAHTYERLDRPEGEFFHTNWTGSGGNISSTRYDV